MRKSPLKRQSKKQAKSDRLVSKAKRDAFELFQEEHGRIYCTGCGASSVAINPSHIVPIGYNKELESVVENIIPQCQEKCHKIWELQLEGVEKLFNYKELLETVKKLDLSYYNKITSKL